MRSRERLYTILAIVLVVTMGAALVAVFSLSAPFIGQQQTSFGTSLVYVLLVALLAIVLGATTATGIQAIFTPSSPLRRPNLGPDFQRNVRVFAWIVGSISASYTVVTIAERLIDALLASG